MDLRKLFTKRINILFGFGCMLPVAMYIASLPTVFFAVLESLGLAEKSAATDFYVNFAVPQFLYPVLSFIIFFFALKTLKLRVGDAVPDKKVKPVACAAAVPLFLALSLGLTYLTNLIFTLLEEAGIQLPTIESVIPTPSGAVQSGVMILVMAVLPAVCEEFVYRASFVSTLSVQSKGAAVLLSSIAFGLMHGTVQQIPFAFMLGIILAEAFVITESFRVPVILHFVNNFISCVLLILQYRMPEDLFTAVNNAITCVIIAGGIISAIYFVINRKEYFTSLPSPIKTGEGMKLACRAPFFWLFIAVYLVITAVNTVVFAIAY